MQGLEADSEDLCRAGLVVPGGFEGLEDEHALGVIDRAADFYMNAAVVEGGSAIVTTDKPLSKGRRKVARFEITIFAQNDRALDGITQFADIAGPVMRHEAIQHLAIDTFYLAA